MRKKIKIEKMADEIAKLMSEYSDEVETAMKQEAQSVANKGRNMLKNISPTGKGSKKGHYKEGWTVNKQKSAKSRVNLVIHNNKKPGLTHLLEDGHAKRNGGRVEGIPHISTTEKYMMEEYEERLKRRLSK